ncbi:zinc-ribbon domain-containing protein [Tolypothrix sp. NIES-4075]
MDSGDYQAVLERKTKTHLTSLPSFCRHCGAKLELSPTFCPSCGKKVSA